MSSAPPTPVFIQQNNAPLTHLLFSRFDADILYSGNRNGDFAIYNCKYRRPVFSSNANKNSIMSMVELNQNELLTHNRNGTIFKWTGRDSSSLVPKCKMIYFSLSTSISIFY